MVRWLKSKRKILGLKDNERGVKMKLKIKWFSICILLCLIITILTSFIPSNEIRFGINQILGLIAGAYCMTEYMSETLY